MQRSSSATRASICIQFISATRMGSSGPKPTDSSPVEDLILPQGPCKLATRSLSSERTAARGADPGSSVHMSAMPRFARTLVLLGATTALSAGPLVSAFADTPPQAVIQMPSFSPIVDKVLPSVVNISVIEKNVGPVGDDEDGQAVPDEGPSPGMPGDGTPFDEFLHRFFEQQGPRGFGMPMQQGPVQALG